MAEESCAYAGPATLEAQKIKQARSLTIYYQLSRSGVGSVTLKDSSLSVPRSYL